MVKASSVPPLPRGLGLGSWVFAGDYWGDSSGNESIKVIHAALRGGVRHFDTAPAYGGGKAEQLLGQQLRKERDRLFLASKFYPTLPENVEKGLNKSLKRLMINRVDAYYVHWPNEKCDLPGILAELTRLKEAGKIGRLGVSNFSPSQLTEALRWAPIDLYQGAYSLAWPLADEEILPLCADRGIDFVAYSPLAQGLLAASPEMALPSDGRNQLLLCREPYLTALRALQHRLREVSEASGRSSADLALAWALGAPGVAAVLAGARTRKQMEANLTAAAAPLPADIRKELDREAEKIRDLLLKDFTAEENPWGHRQS